MCAGSRRRSSSTSGPQGESVGPIISDEMEAAHAQGLVHALVRSFAMLVELRGAHYNRLSGLLVLPPPPHLTLSRTTEGGFWTLC